MINNISAMTDINEVSSLRDTLDPLSKEWQEAEETLRNLLKLKYKDENVLVIESNMMPDYIEEGFTPLNNSLFCLVTALDLISIIEKYGIFIPRYMVEFNPAFKQIIPYTIAMAPDGSVFTMKRIKGDSRLVGKLSLGIGGHIDSLDINDNIGLVEAGLRREIKEEVEMGENTFNSLHLRGCIYDPSNAVGQDHLGLAYILNTNDNEIRIKETENLEGAFLPVDRLLSLLNEKIEIETWSRIIIDNLLR